MRTSGSWRHCVAVLVLVVAGCSSHHVEYLEPVAPHQTNITTHDPRGEWVSIRPTQCSTSDSWRRDWVRANGYDYPFEHDLALLNEYCSKRGIVVFDIATRPENAVVCAACSCPAQYSVFILVGAEYVGAMTGFGFHRVQSR